MSSFDDYGNTMELGASASPGLATLPAEGGTAAPPLIPSDEQGPPPQATPSLGLDKPSGSGLGMATFKSARSDDDKAYLAGLPTSQKIGLMLQSFSAGVNGGANPIDAMLENKRKQEAEFRNELGTTVKTITAGMQVVKSMPPGKARDALIEQITRAAGGGSEVKNALLSVGTDQEQAVRDSVAALDTPAAQALLVKMSGGDPEKARALLKDDSTLKLIHQTADQTILPGLLAKMRVLSRAMAKMPQYADGQTGTASFSLSDLIEQNKALPEQFQLSDAELAAARRNQASLIPYGLKTDITAQAEQSADVKRAPLSEYGKINDDLLHKRITPAQAHDAYKRADNKVVIQQQAIDKGKGAGVDGYTPEQIDVIARQAMKDKSVLFNIGRGTQGAKDLQAINKRMADIMIDEGGAGTADQRAAFGADKKSLDKLVPQLDAIEAFSNNAIQQGKVLKGLAQKVDTTGVPVIERWIRAGRSSVAGDADVSEFNAQLQLYRTEAAKIITNPNLTAQLTDAARKEVQHFLDGNASAPQIVRVVDRLEKDFGIRHNELLNQIDVVKSRMAGGAKPRASDASAPSASAPLPLPTDKSQLVRGKKYQTQRGVATWNGTAFEQ